MIEVKNLVKKYGSHLAVDHLNFTVDTGQIYGFLGPNGAGKSTTMNIMTGYLGATEGEVLINGHNILEEPEAAKKCIGYLPEMPPLYTDMKVNEYLRFVAELKKIPKKEREEQIEKVMLMVKIVDVQRARVGDKPIFVGRSYHFELTLDLAGLAPEDVGAELVVARPVEPDRVVEVIRIVPLSQVQVSGSQVTFALDYVPEQAGMFDMALRIFPQNPMLPHRMDFALVKWA